MLFCRIGHILVGFYQWPEDKTHWHYAVMRPIPAGHQTFFGKGLSLPAAIENAAIKVDQLS